MDLREHALPTEVAGLAEEAIATVRRWLTTTRVAVRPEEDRLSEILAEDGGADFLLGVVDGVLRPADPRVAGRNLERLSREVPRGVRWYADLGVQLAAGFAPLAPAPVAPLVREAFLKTIGHLLLRLDGRELDKQLAEIVEPGGVRPVLEPVMAFASGDREADRQATDARELLRYAEVAALALGLPGVVGRARPLDLDRTVEAAVDRLEHLHESAGSSSSAKSIILDVDGFDELEPALRVLERMSAQHPDVELGITLSASLPDSLPALERVDALARRRRVAGATGITVRLTRGEHVAEELAEAERRGRPAATFADRASIDAQYLRLLDAALAPRAAVRVVSSSPDLFAAAFAWRLARVRKAEGRLEHEFRLGVATGLAEAVKRDVGGIRLAVPVVQPGQLALAVPYLLARLHELSDPDHPVATALRLADARVFSAESERFLAAVGAMPQAVPATFRRQDAIRTEAADFAVPAARGWALGVLARARDSAAGEALLARSSIAGPDRVAALVEGAVAAGTSWGERRGTTRATVIESVAEVLAEWRGLLVEVAVSERGLMIEEADEEVTVAIALAATAASAARELDAVAGAEFVPPKLVVVAAPRSSPLAEPAGAVLAALAAGAAVIVKAAPEARRSAAVLVETLTAAGVPEGLVGLLDDEGEAARTLLNDERVDRVVHLGSRHTAKLFHSWRAETALDSTTGGRNAIIVTPSADLESAVADIVESALDHAGQASTAVSSVILVGSVGESTRFLGRLADAVASVRAGRPGTVGTGLSSLARSASGGVEEALDVLDPGERWLVRPRRLDDSGRRWSPGLRDGVEAASAFRRRENRAPVLGILRAGSLQEAIELQNAPGFGLAAGLQSLDPDEVSLWLELADAGLLCVNRPIVTGLRARMPVSGWNRSAVGTGGAAGGQDAALLLGSWHPLAAEPGETVTLDGVSEPVARFIQAAQPGMDFTGFDRVRAGAQSDEIAWRRVFAPREVVVGLERDIVRYRPVPVTIRLSEGEPIDRLVRVLAAAALTGAAVAVSTATPLHAGLIELFAAPDSPVGVAEVLVESEVRWRARVQAGEIATTRIRLLGGDPLLLSRVLHGQPGIAVHAGAVTASGRVELLPFLREQSIVLPAGRFGRSDPAMTRLPMA
jgi:RHH-type proline utilization regulon transcriptional repressor/proline dehydrogenase/delta 1-pyrroline-5-carboxylate dehydrogenase